MIDSLLLEAQEFLHLCDKIEQKIQSKKEARKIEESNAERLEDSGLIGSIKPIGFLEWRQE